MDSWFGKLTVDVISEIGFQYSMNALDDSDEYKVSNVISPPNLLTNGPLYYLKAHVRESTNYS